MKMKLIFILTIATYHGQAQAQFFLMPFSLCGVKFRGQKHSSLHISCQHTV